MVLDAALLNTQHYKVRIKGKMYNPRNGVAPYLHLGVVAIEKGAFGSPSTKVTNFTLFTYTHTHTHIYIYIYKCICMFIYIYLPTLPNKQDATKGQFF